MFTTVIGFGISLGIIVYIMMQFIASAMPFEDAVIVDPKPETKF